jgi:hypothetical protein
MSALENDNQKSRKTNGQVIENGKCNGTTKDINVQKNVTTTNIVNAAKGITPINSPVSSLFNVILNIIK